MRISRIQWIIIATMSLHVLFALADILLISIPALFPFQVIRLLECFAFAILVSLGIGWARVLFAICLGISILTGMLGLCFYFVDEEKYEQLGNYVGASQVSTLLVLAFIHLPLAIWTMWLLVSSESATEFFFQKNIEF